jgi:uncharacterized protein (DUF1800 family)
MLAQNRKLRSHALGTFPELLRAVTTDPAMQGFLSLVDSDKRDPNENYARELMELFTLGVTAGYTERDVREAARALTGFKGHWHDGRPLTVSYDPERHDDGVKQLLGPPRQARLAGRPAPRRRPSRARSLPRRQAVGLLRHRAAAGGDPRRLARVYVRSHHRIAPVVREILDSRALYADLDHPQMVKWPIVQMAGNLRMVGRAIDTDDWAWIGSMMGQMPFRPAQRRRLGLGRGVDVDRHHARALLVRDVDLQGRAGQGRQGHGRPEVDGRRARAARPRRHRGGRGRARRPTASCTAWRSAS